MFRQDLVAKLIAQHFPEKAKRSQIQVLDLAAGTGLVGERLKKFGFTQVDAVDGSESMLKVLDSKNVYRRSWKCLLGKSTDSIDQVQDESYDVVIISGGFAHGHIDIRVLRQAARALKENGIFINAMTELYLKLVPHLHGLEPLLFKMEKEGIWKVIFRLVTEDQRPDLYHICRKL